MSTQQTAAPVHASIVVDAPIDRAFTVFTAEIGSWWPPEHHLLEGELAETSFEPHVGGRIVDRSADGRECAWARVLAYEPPHRVLFSWDITSSWQIESEPEKTSEVEVRFIEDGPGRTRVELTHAHLERHGAGWEGMREAVSSDDGWPVGLRAFAAVAAG